MKNPNWFPMRSEFGFFIYIKDISCCCLSPEDGRILRAYRFICTLDSGRSFRCSGCAESSEGKPEGIESPKPQA